MHQNALTKKDFVRTSPIVIFV
jgi:hypothetical protein